MNLNEAINLNSSENLNWRRSLSWENYLSDDGIPTEVVADFLYFGEDQVLFGTDEVTL